MRFLVLIMLMSSLPAYAGLGGYYYGAQIDEYDKASGLYFKSVEKEVEAGGFLTKGSNLHVTDLNIFNPETGSNTKVFNDGKLRQIVTIIFESFYDAENNSMVFAPPEHFSSIKNNHGITNRKPRNKILIYVVNNKAKSGELWSANKTGQELKKLKSFNMDSDWHIDVKNSKIRIVSQTGTLINIDSIDW